MISVGGRGSGITDSAELRDWRKVGFASRESEATSVTGERESNSGECWTAFFVRGAAAEPEASTMDQLFGNLKTTVCILIAFSILVTSRQYIGDPIDCISKDGVPHKVLNTFCWIHTTFSLTDAWHKKVACNYTLGEKRVYHAYYQWVCFVLFLQAVLFCVPRYFWKAGRSKAKQNSRKLLVEYLLISLNSHNAFYYGYVTAEVCNFVNVVGQMFLMDNFPRRRVLLFTQWDSSVRYDPMIKVFPRLTKCTFHMFGPSGDVQRYDAFCILPINIIHEKIYVFLWFWFIILACMSGAVLIYRAFIILVPRARFSVLSKLDNKDYVKRACDCFKLGDWLVLELLCKNMDYVNFKVLINDYVRRLGHKSVDNA
ncbi:hypothetical protein HPB48_000836 [Haemaphysalis longicornis]|uniref:Innexin n=1 Tax=Haemaphysalis longicornis TaxID=44386 RepID=A0A9J6GY95_HAELO|nr:hypothetical protein HPB48_000836 [Haemaphysalis longicornis]